MDVNGFRIVMRWQFRSDICVDLCLPLFQSRYFEVCLFYNSFGYDCVSHVCHVIFLQANVHNHGLGVAYDCYCCLVQTLNHQWNRSPNWFPFLYLSAPDTTCFRLSLRQMDLFVYRSQFSVSCHLEFFLSAVFTCIT